LLVRKNTSLLTECNKQFIACKKTCSSCGTIKQALTLRDRIYNCNNCGISNWNNKPISLELEHKDGNYKNNSPENIELLCPNCHSQTPTFKGKNKGNGRYKRMDRYYNGKSY
jgi:Zn finger protein HypA/HybF involved in hydrogenase expression